MSNRNSQEAKRAARERMRAEREREEKRAKVRRNVIVGGAIVVVLAAAGGIGYALTNLNKNSGSASATDWTAAKKKPLVKPAHTAGADGTTLIIAGKGAKQKMDVYEDLRCPACAQMEQIMGKIIVNGAKQGKYQYQVHLGDLIDNNLGGGGSKSAISALGAALNISPAAYTEYHDALYSTKYHPDEEQDKFSDKSYLQKVADTVPALKGNQQFSKNLQKGTYDRWALAMVADFDKGKIKGTPTFRLNGKDVDTTKLPATLQKLGVKLPKTGQSPSQ